MSLADHFTPQKRLLICAATGIEANSLLSGMREAELVEEQTKVWQAKHYRSFSVLMTGVGKANASGAIASVLTKAPYEGRTYSAVLNIGIAGALASKLKAGMSVLSDSMFMADEGTPLAGLPNWRSLEDGGFAINKFTCNKSGWWNYLAGIVDEVGPIATISTVSGTAELAKQYVERTAAIAEGMEGAAIALVCAHFEIECAELRTISNLCGNSNREENPWDFPAALNKLRSLGALIKEKESVI